jgi:methenyltetrahydrofolate cyclohydrolase
VEGESIGGWLDALASSAPAPGGGAAAALEAAMAAALLEMVCNLTIGKPAYAEHDETRSGWHKRTRRRSVL